MFLNSKIIRDRLTVSGGIEDTGLEKKKPKKIEGGGVTRFAGFYNINYSVKMSFWMSLTVLVCSDVASTVLKFGSKCTEPLHDLFFGLVTAASLSKSCLSTHQRILRSCFIEIL